MSEIVVEETAYEVVIDIEGGPTLTTTIEQELQTLIETPASPVVIDLNSGARGEPGSAVLTGLFYPGPEIGTVGDIFIVLGEEEPEYLGAVLQKGNLGWVYQGNIRGPIGGINSINGYTLPDVVLTKADIGLGNADNTSDANKPISTAAQTALDLKADDDEVVKLTGAQTIAGVKTFSNAPVFTIAPSVPDNSWTIAKTTNLQANLDGRVSLAGNQTITDTKTFTKTPLITPETGLMLPTQMTSHNMHMWHDRFRFTAPVFTQSADGTNWGAPITNGHAALDGRSDTTYSFSDTTRYARWYWDTTYDFAYANIARLIARWGYVATNPDAVVTVESSSNGTAWTNRGTYTMTPASTQQFTMALSDNGGDTHYRVTIQIVGGATSGTIASLHMLEIQNYRHGSQGRGFQTEYPYWWNATQEIGLYNHLRPMANGTIDIGLTGTRFKDAYFSGVVNGGTFAGSGASLTSLNGSNISTGTVADARLSTNVVLLNSAQSITAVKTFTVSPIVPTPTTDFQAATKKYIDDAIIVLTNGSPALLNTLDELAQALGDDPNFATTITNSIATKVSLTGDETISGVKTFNGTDTYIVRHRAPANSTLNSRTDMTLGSVAGDIKVVRKHEHVGATNGFHLVDMLHRRASGSDWQTTQWYQGNGVDTSYLDSPTTGASKLRTWIMRDPQNSTIAIGDSGNTFLTLTNTAITVGASAVFTGNGSGLTTLNGSNISSGTVADARLSTNVVLLTGAQTITGVKTFSASPVVPDSTFTIAKTTGLQAALDAKQANLNNATAVNNIDWNTIVLNGSYAVNGSGGMGANGPSGTPVYGNLVVHHTGNVVTQIYYPHQPQAGVVAYARSKYNASDWQAWRPLADATQAVYRVVHNGTSWPSRPTGATSVEWVGPVVPTAATANDTWVNSTV